MTSEDKIRESLQRRADQVEPSPESYATLAEKVLAASSRPTPWWQTPRLLWISAAGGLAAIVLFAAVVVTNRDSAEETEATGPTTEPTESVDGADEAVVTDDTETPTPVPFVGSGQPLLWPLTEPDDTWPTTGPEAVIQFYEQVLGIIDPPLGALQAADPAVEQYLVYTRGEDGQVRNGDGQEVANFAVAEFAPGRWGVASIVANDVMIDGSDQPQSLESLALVGFGRGFEGTVAIQLLGANGQLVGSGLGAGGTTDMVEFPVVLDEILLPEYQGPALVVLSTPTVIEGGVPAVTAWTVQISADAPGSTPGDPIEGPPADGLPNGIPDGIIWPIHEVEPFGEWPSTPEDAAFVFVDAMIDEPFELGPVSYSGEFGQLATVEAFGVAEDGVTGVPFTTVQLAGGVAFESAPNWGVTSAQDPEIVITGGEFQIGVEGLLYTVQGFAQAFEGVVNVRLQDASQNPLATSFVMGGGTELLPVDDFFWIGDAEGGPGFVVFTDVGGRGVPVSMTVRRVDIPPFSLADTEPLPVDDPCSADGRAQPEPQEGLPEAVEATRQAIAAAAISCDYEQLAALLGDGNYSFGDGGDPAGFWRQMEESGDAPMWFLVEMLNQTWLEDTGVAGPVTIFVWPDFFVLAWDDLTIGEVDYLVGVYGQEAVDGWAEFGSYAGWRVGISSEGEWLSFVAGD